MLLVSSYYILGVPYFWVPILVPLFFPGAPSSPKQVLLDVLGVVHKARKENLCTYVLYIYRYIQNQHIYIYTYTHTFFFMPKSSYG